MAPTSPFLPMPFGTVYLIDPQLTAEHRRRDLENIRATGMNTVVLWPAATRWDAERPGGLAFDTIDRVMDDCRELGLRAIIELQGQQTHQEMAPHSAAIMPRLAQHRTRREFAWNHPDFQEATLTYIRQVAQHFLGHPALLAYDVFNEVGNHSQDIWTRRAFAAYLRRRYGDDLGRLNDRWGTHFVDFDAIAEYEVLHSSTIDWWSIVPKRDWYAFRHQNFIDLLDAWTAAVRDVDPRTPVFADVLGCDTQQDRNGDYFGVNDWDIAEHSDVLGLSCYANMLPEPFWETQAWAWPMFWRTADAAARGKPVVISEMMTANRTLLPTEFSSMTDEVGLWSAQAFFHGVDGLIYWKWRPFRRGLQVGGRGMTDNNGTPNDQAEQAAAVAEWVAKDGPRLAELRPDHAGCAILHDHNTQHLLHAMGPTPPGVYLDSGMGLFYAFWRRGISPTFLAGRLLDTEGVPADIHVLVVPCGLSCSQAQADHLKAFLDRGGTLVTESRFGLIDEDGNLWDHAPRGGLHEQLAFTEKRLNARYVGRVSSVGLELQHEHVQDRLELAHDTKVTLAFDDGIPLFIHRAVSQGRHLHCTGLLGSLIHRKLTGALNAFDVLFTEIQKNLSPSLAITNPPANIDVAVLNDSTGRAAAVGITSFQHEPITFKLLDIAAVDRIVPQASAEVVKSGEDQTVRVPPRTATLLWLDLE
ncbi:MAG: alpha-amylase family protein [Planctomycetota bacterium]